MTKLLAKAGVSKEVLDLVPEIKDTCVACRTWARPLPDAQATVELADKFNEQVECDLMFMYRFYLKTRRELVCSYASLLRT